MLVRPRQGKSRLFFRSFKSQAQEASHKTDKSENQPEISLAQSQQHFFNVPEYAGNIGDAKDKEAREKEQNHILQLVDKF